MYKLKKICRLFALMMVLTIVSPSVLPISSATVAEAAAVKLSKKEITLEVGKSQTLKLTGTKQKITWTTSKKTVAVVSTTGKVTAKKAGTAVITATANKKKYTCKVTVKAAVVKNPNVTNAPFAAQELKYNKISYIVPKGWTAETVAEQGTSAALSIHPTVDATDTDLSSVTLTITDTGTPKTDYSVLKEYFKGSITEDLIKSQLAQSGIETELVGFTQSDYETTLGTAFKIEYSFTYNDITIKQAIYELNIDNYLLEVNITDIGDGLTPDINTVGEYLLNTLQVTK